MKRDLQALSYIENAHFYFVNSFHVCMCPGFLNLETTTEEVLGWTGDHAKITVKMLGNMVSGLSNADGYCNNPAVRSPAVNMTLTQCAEYFHTYGKDEKSGGAALRTGGGDRLTYGPSHWYVLASMAEKVSGLSWNQLLEKHIKKPLGLENPDFQFAQWVFDIQDFSRYKVIDFIIIFISFSSYSCNIMMQHYPILFLEPCHTSCHV